MIELDGLCGRSADRNHASTKSACMHPERLELIKYSRCLCMHALHRELR